MQGGERFGDGLGQRLRVRRGHHAARSAQEQFVAQQPAQPPQGIAHARLGDAQVLRRQRYPAVPVQGVEDDQQIQIQVLEIHVCALAIFTLVIFLIY